MGTGVGQDSHRRAPPACPRCGRPLREPTAWSSAWRCDWHGEVHPLLPAFSPSRDGLDGLLHMFRPGTAGVPVWLPWPLPAGWLVAGFAGVGDERTGVRACAVALAGLDSVDPGAGFGSAPAIATASFGKHDFPLWQVHSPDRAVFAGEVKGLWLWVVLWPDTAGTLLVEPLALRDLRDPGQRLDLPFGAASPRLPAR